MTRLIIISPMISLLSFIVLTPPVNVHVQSQHIVYQEEDIDIPEMDPSDPAAFQVGMMKVYSTLWH